MSSRQIVLGYESGGSHRGGDHARFPARGFHGCLVRNLGGAVASGRLLQLDAARLPGNSTVRDVDRG